MRLVVWWGTPSQYTDRPWSWLADAVTRRWKCDCCDDVTHNWAVTLLGLSIELELTVRP